MAARGPSAPTRSLGLRARGCTPTCSSCCSRPVPALSPRRSAGAGLPRALEARDDLAVVGDPSERFGPAPDALDVQSVTVAGHNALDAQHVLGSAGDAFVDHEVLGRAESHGATLPHVVVDRASDRLVLEPGKREAE